MNESRSVRLAALAVVSCVVGVSTTGAPSSASGLPHCRSGQLKLSGGLQGATQSLLGALTLANRTAHACALPVAPSRVSLVVGTQLLPALTMRMRGGIVPPGVPTRRLAAHGRVSVGVQWRNWCNAPRGNVRLSVVLAIFPSVTPRVGVGVVRTPPCLDHKFSSRVAVSRFIRTAA